MSARLRLWLFLPFACGLGALLAWALLDVPGFGSYRRPYGLLLNRVAVPERHTTNVVSSIVFDYRGFDTLGEELILFAAVVGVVLLLRAAAPPERRAETASWLRVDSLLVVGTLMVGGTTLVGLWLVAFGYVTPGGGFQGGVVIASGAVLLYLVAGHRAFSPFGDERVLDPLEATGAGAYVVVGIAALVSGLPYLTNLFGVGQLGTLRSGGSIALLNWATGLEVAAANLVLFAEFLKEYVKTLPRSVR